MARIRRRRRRSRSLNPPQIPNYVILIIVVFLVFEILIFFLDGVEAFDEVEFVPGHVEGGAGELGTAVARAGDAFAGLVERGDGEDAVDDGGL